MRRTTEEEMDDIKLCIILPVLLDLIDKWEWFPDPTPLKHLHESQFQDLRDMITIDHVEAKKRLKVANVKMVKKEKFSPSLDYTIYVRRQVENIGFMKLYMKAEASRFLGKYVVRLDKTKFKPQPSERVNGVGFVDRKLSMDF